MNAHVLVLALVTQQVVQLIRAFHVRDHLEPDNAFLSLVHSVYCVVILHVTTLPSLRELEYLVRKDIDAAVDGSKWERDVIVINRLVHHVAARGSADGALALRLLHLGKPLWNNACSITTIEGVVRAKENRVHLLAILTEKRRFIENGLIGRKVGAMVADQEKSVDVVKKTRMVLVSL